MSKVFTSAQIVFGAAAGAWSAWQLRELPLPLLFLLTIWLFDGAMHAYARWQAGRLHWFLAWIWAPGMVVVGLLDILVFQLIVGTIHFREPPRELLFSSRVQRHADEAPYDSDEYRAALFWAGVLNNIDPDHITIRRRG